MLHAATCKCIQCRIARAAPITDTEVKQRQQAQRRRSVKPSKPAAPDQTVVAREFGLLIERLKDADPTFRLVDRDELKTLLDRHAVRRAA